ncbi:MAG: segregation/condensation protein A [Parachlamydia sp.]|jgi:segregation and condensation protein A|nr:segregation/condensation protein A [Parachlamydia sp.]
MISTSNDRFALNNFEGPLDFLLSLIQKEEINIYDVSIQTLTQQFIHKLQEWEGQTLDKGAEFVGSAAYLVWLKSKTLLPDDKQVEETFIPEEDPRFEIIHHLIDYCRFKQTAKQLALKEEQERHCYFRGLPAHQRKRPLGLDTITLDELTAVFSAIMQRARPETGLIAEEDWKTSDKIACIRLSLRQHPKMPFAALFEKAGSKLECVVIFLALLELLKLGQAKVALENQEVIVYKKQEES